MAKFDVPFANTPGNRRVPTGAEYTNGFPCGPLDQQLFNFLMYAPQAEIGAVLAAAGLTQTNSDFTQLLQALRKLFPIKQSTSPILYVRPDGNDANDGSANTAAKAFLTLSAAIAYGGANFYLPNGVGLDIRLGVAGTYAAPNTISGPPSVYITGNSASPSTYIIAGSGGSNHYSIVQAAGSDVSLTGVTVQNNAATSSNVGASNGHLLSLQDVRLLTASGSTPALIASSNGTINIFSGVVAAGGANTCFNAQLGGLIGILENFTFSGTLAFPGGTAAAAYAGIITLRVPTITMSGGTITGQRYVVSQNAMISSAGNGANYFPGSTAGAASTGGQYS